LRAYLHGHHVTVSGDEEHIVKCEGFGEILKKHDGMKRRTDKRSMSGGLFPLL
jgi:hypothetical protein